MKNIFIAFIAIVILTPNCPAEEQNNITVLDQYYNETYVEMVKLLGAPIDKTGYTIKKAPTKAWNHHELFSEYPKTAENENIQIMEVAWDDGKFIIVACFHMINSENRCLVAKKIRKEIKF